VFGLTGFGAPPAGADLAFPLHAPGSEMMEMADPARGMPR
jgi:hypothetical protein